MKYFYSIILIFSSILSILSQTNTDVFLFDLNTENGKFLLSNMKNISNNEGYDNQPSFLDNNIILYAGTRNGQTDIVKYYINYDSKVYVNHTDGGEYTPLKIPNKNEVSAVRLDADGKQRLYAYSLRNGESTELIENLVVAYYTWFDHNTIVSAIIEDNELNLYVIDVENGASKKYATKVGRSFHKIPNSNLVSFISKENENQWQIKSINPKTGTIKTIANTIQNVEDISWLNDNTIISGKDNILYKLTLKKDNSWTQIADLKTNGISKITRIAINPEYKMLLIAGDVDENIKVIDKNTKTDKQENAATETSEIEAIVQNQLDAYNNRDIDAFMATYSKDIKLYNYPNELRTDGPEQMRKSYEQWFKQTPDLRAFIKSRIVIGNKVIDEEQLTANGKIFNAVAIYEIENGLIKKVTFIQ
ncbi:MAG: nuclear transport factor 2 family protein [Flavobacteriaceae bacterium]